jgi:hypothetical protein
MKTGLLLGTVPSLVLTSALHVLILIIENNDGNILKVEETE